MGKEKEAEADRSRGLKMKATDSADLVARGIARLPADPRGALADFQAAEKLAPRSIEPLQNQANVQAELLHRPARAVEILDRMLKYHPEYVVGLCGRAVYLARAGRIDEAIRQGKSILELSDTPFTQYRVGCVYALAAKKNPDSEKEALGLIARALKKGEGYAYLHDDSDLDPIRKTPDFKTLLQFVKKLESLEQSPAKPRASAGLHPRE
jgi:tetratricopeptide (TPR) repeat protein